MNDLLNLLIGLAMGLNLVALGTSRLPSLIRVAALQGMMLGIMPLVIEHEWRVMVLVIACLLYTSPSPRDRTRSRMPSSA